MNDYRISEGAEKHIGVTYPVLVGTAQVGLVTLRDYMGTDQSIVGAARISYEGRPKKSDDAKLINYLWQHKHTSPFEQVMLTFEIEAPIYVARQWMRHRTQSINEMSGRYTELPSVAHLPDIFRFQSQDAKNKQASSGVMIAQAEEARELMEAAYAESFEVYRKLLDAGVSREIARSVVPVGTMTKWVFTQSLHNLLHWHRLRIDSHAQPEIQEFAKVIETVLTDGWPMTMQAAKRYKAWTIDMKAFDTLEEHLQTGFRSIGVEL